MVVDKYRLVNEETAETALTKDHPLVQAAYSIEEVLFDRAEAEGTDEAKAACQKAIDLMDTGICMIFEITWAKITPLITPITPPRLVSTADSVKNCSRIRFFLAPMAFFRPISLVRSVTDTSMIFITPMPPTSREILAIQMSWLLVACVHAHAAHLGEK